MSECVVAIDLGGTHLRAAVVDRDGQILAQGRCDTPADQGPEAVMDAMAGQASDAIQEAGDPAVGGACIAAPGPLDPKKGVVFSAPNLPGWEDFPLARSLADRLEMPAWAHNDANLAALGEAVHGAGRDVAALIYLTVSTGVGGGIVRDGQMYEGQHGLAGELGHVIVNADGPACNFGHPGCLEGLASGTAVARAARRRLRSGEEVDAILGNRAAERGPDSISARHVAEAAREGDPMAAEIVADAARMLGLAIGGFINALDPNMVVIGGGLGLGAWDLMAEPVATASARVVMSPAARTVSIVPAELGDDSGLIGAAVHAWRMVGG